MNKTTLTGLFAEAIYQIPDYQRGYAWEEKQWKDFIQDIDALVDEQVTSHYTGTVVVYAGRDAEVRPYGTRRMKVVDVVDGQQRLTTSCLYLSVIIRSLVREGESDYERDIPDFLYSGATCKLALNNDTGNIFYDLLKTGRINTPAQSPHSKRLVTAYNRLQNHINTQLANRSADGVTYLKELYYAITQKLHFTSYTIEEECEIGMTFELMNSRGKDLSVLELLKNYLMHWAYRNVTDESERNALTKLINKDWKDTYTNLGASAGDEDQCLRIAWTLYCSHTPKNWKGYDGFKRDEYIPLRTFIKRTKADTKAYIERFADGLAEISSYYASITCPTKSNTLSAEEHQWLTKIHHTGNIANFLPLMVAARKHCESGNIEEVDYIALLRALECYAYRVFLYSSHRSNAGKSNFHRWGYEILAEPRLIHDVIPLVHNLTRYYAPEQIFTSQNANPSDWYSSRRLLRYTLFEYELYLLAKERHGQQPKLTWEELTDSTIEHILPQTPDRNSHWKTVWSTEEAKACKHDIANLVLTLDNSSYSNFEFVRKKGTPGVGISYSNSGIRQEQKIAGFLDWTPLEFAERRRELIAWINDRWKTESPAVIDVGDLLEAIFIPMFCTTLQVNDEEDDDETEAFVEGTEP